MAIHVEAFQFLSVCWSVGRLVGQSVDNFEYSWVLLVFFGIFFSIFGIICYFWVFCGILGYFRCLGGSLRYFGVILGTLVTF